MVGSPFQTTENLISDLRFLQELEPDMIGIGPYLTHAETPFHIYSNGSFELTLKFICSYKNARKSAKNIDKMKEKDYKTSCIQEMACIHERRGQK